MDQAGWGARIRTWDRGSKVHCLTAWPHPNHVREEIRRKPTTLYRTHCIVHDEVGFVNTTKGASTDYPSAVNCIAPA